MSTRPTSPNVRRLGRRLLTAIVLLATLAAAAPQVFAQGCAMCRTALDGQPDPLTQAFTVSTLFLMATPYTIVGTIGVWIFLAVRRRDRQNAASE